MVAVQPYAAFQQSFDEGLLKGHRWYSRTHYFRELSDRAIDTLVASFELFRERARVPCAYGTNYDRLVALKRTWDPDNVFCRNRNIDPSG